jgi:hypothetical protein
VKARRGSIEFPEIALGGDRAYSGDSTAMKRIHLDHNSTTRVDAAVLEAVLPFFAGEFGAQRPDNDARLLHSRC